MIISEMQSFIDRVRWKTAKSGDHSYNVRKWHEDDREFVEFVREIRKSGYDNYFQGYKYRYLDIDGYMYWTMGAPLDDTIIINRAKVQKEKLWIVGKEREAEKEAKKEEEKKTILDYGGGG